MSRQEYPDKKDALTLAENVISEAYPSLSELVRDVAPLESILEHIQEGRTTDASNLFKKAAKGQVLTWRSLHPEERCDAKENAELTKFNMIMTLINILIRLKQYKEDSYISLVCEIKDWRCRWEMLDNRLTLYEKDSLPWKKTTNAIVRQVMSTLYPGGQVGARECPESWL
jgi:hypothetical protein